MKLYDDAYRFWYNIKMNLREVGCNGMKALI
jgi:hypothetical protein